MACAGVRNEGRVDGFVPLEDISALAVLDIDI
jgi:hypothetical protein